MPRPDLVLVWRVTTRCQLDCRFCGFACSQPGPRQDANPGLVQGLGALLAGHAARSGARVLVSLLGGEPLLWPAWYATARHLRQPGGLAVSLTTNGLPLAHAEVRDQVCNALDELVISLDGPAAIHDHLRRRPGLFCALESATRDLAQRHRAGGGPRLAVNTVLMRDNVRHFPDLCATLAGWGVQKITFNRLGGLARPDFHRDHALRPEDLAGLMAGLPDLRRDLRRAGTELCGSDEYLLRIAAAAQGAGPGANACQPGRASLFLDETGGLAPCPYVPAAARIPLAALVTEVDLATLPDRFTERLAAARPAACRDCPANHAAGKYQSAA